MVVDSNSFTNKEQAILLALFSLYKVVGDMEEGGKTFFSVRAIAEAQARNVNWYLYKLLQSLEDLQWIERKQIGRRKYYRLNRNGVRAMENQLITVASYENHIYEPCDVDLRGLFNNA